MPSVSPNIYHPHITYDPNVCGGGPVIAGTRFPVRSVVHYVLHLGLAPEEMVEKFPHLTLSKVYDALAYYYDNVDEIMEDITDNTEENLHR